MPDILIYRIGQLGDTLIALPAIEAIRQKYPSYRLILLTDRHQTSKGYVSSWDILQPTGWFDQVIYYDAQVQGATKLIQLFDLIKKLRTLELEHLYNLAPIRSKLATVRDEIFFRHLSGTKSYHARSNFVPPGATCNGLPELMPEWQSLFQITNNTLPKDHSFRLPIPENERDKAVALMQSENINPEMKFIIIGPGSKMPAKLWPIEFFEELGKKFLNKYPGFMLIIVGGKEDSSAGENLCAAWGERSFNFAGKLSIYGSAALLQKSVLYVGNDTGTMHLAAMAGTPCLALFSARDYPGKWSPYGDQHTVLRRAVECEGCMYQVCEYNNKCLKDIKPDEVFDVLKKMIESI